MTKVKLISCSAPLALFLASLAAQTVPANLTHDRDLVFQPARTQGPALAMDIVRPGGKGPYPAAVLIHGGGFHSGDRTSMLPLAIRLAQHGYVAAAVSYRLTPRFQFPAQVHDVKTAVRYLRANAARLSLDPRRICTIGASAGGTLALFLGLTRGIPRFEGGPDYREHSSDVNCVVNLYGRSDLTTAYGGSRNAGDVLPALVGGELPYTRNAHLDASPIAWVNPASAPVLSIHGTLDLNVPYPQSAALQARLQAAGVRAELETIEGAGHGFRGADAERADRVLIAFLDRELRQAADRLTVLVSDHGAAAELVALGWPSGQVLWRVPNDRGLDVQALPNGHVLFTRDARSAVVELNARREVVWTAGPELGLKKPMSAQRLAGGNTLIGDPQGARVIEVSPDHKIVWKWERPEFANSWLRMCRRTEAGTTLVALQKDGVILELDARGETVWKYAAGAGRLPYQAIRLANGNTLVPLVDPGEVVEVDRSGKTVRSVGGKAGPLRLSWIAGVALLPEGGMMLADFTSRRLVEVDGKGRAVHELRDLPWSIASIAIMPSTLSTSRSAE